MDPSKNTSKVWPYFFWVAKKIRAIEGTVDGDRHGHIAFYFHRTHRMGSPHYAMLQPSVHNSLPWFGCLLFIFRVRHECRSKVLVYFCRRRIIEAIEDQKTRRHFNDMSFCSSTLWDRRTVQRQHRPKLRTNRLRTLTHASIISKTITYFLMRVCAFD